MEPTIPNSNSDSSSDSSSDRDAVKLTPCTAHWHYYLAPATPALSLSNLFSPASSSLFRTSAAAASSSSVSSSVSSSSSFSSLTSLFSVSGAAASASSSTTSTTATTTTTTSENGSGTPKETQWQPFSQRDSDKLEACFQSLALPDGGAEQTQTVSVLGGRYDIHVPTRTGRPVYWSAPAFRVLRATWFKKGETAEDPLVPFDEATASSLEATYREVLATNARQRVVSVSPRGDQVIFHSPNIIVHYQNQLNLSADDSLDSHPRIVFRGFDPLTAPEGESDSIEALIFVIHGIGSACDLQLKSISTCVDDMRTVARSLVKSHFPEKSGRVELLPISWHDALHLHRNVDQKLQNISLDTIKKLRELVNDTILDVLLFTSPIYAQVIIDQVVNELNRLHALFLSRNPSFSGKICLFGHSLGSCISFDILAHQPAPFIPADATGTAPSTLGLEEAQLLSKPPAPIASSTVQLGQHLVKYPTLNFRPFALFAAGSPIGMFLTVRGHDNIGLDYQLPTCANVFNVFHPFDPVAFRIEPLLSDDYAGLKPELIPHYKGRKRIHIEIRDNITKVGATIKRGLEMVDAVTKTSWLSLNPFGLAFGRAQSAIAASSNTGATTAAESANALSSSPPSSFLAAGARTGSESTAFAGRLNSNKRVDYCLQEAPIESINEYVFSLTAHFVYWRSEDTALFMLNRIFDIDDSSEEGDALADRASAMRT